MKIIAIDAYGGPEVLQRKECPIAQPGAGEALVKVAYAGINFMDIHTRQGKYRASQSYPVRLPCTLGMEGAGTVVAVGPDADPVAAGDRVAWCIAWGSYAEFAIVPAARLAKLPPAISFDLAAAAMFQGCTAHYLMHDVARLAAGDTCLIHAASGAIGQLLIQLAKRQGATVFATTSTDAKAAVARQHGADHVMLYNDGQFADAIREATGGAGVDVAFDAVGRATLRDTFRAMRKRGLVVNYGSVSGGLDNFDPIELGEAGSLFLTRPRLADYLTDAITVQRRADDIFTALANRQLTVEIADYYTMDTIEQAHARLESRQQIGKCVLRI